MIQYRRVSALVLGVWLGAGTFADVAVTQNFQTVDRFLAQPNSALTSVALNDIGREKERLILRRNAGEENNYIFENWERAELVLGTALFLILLFGTRPRKSMLAISVFMFFIVLVQHFFLSPAVTDLGRRMADLPGDNALGTRFWTYHGIYSASEIIKLLAGCALAVRLAIRRKQDTDHFAKAYETQIATKQA